MPTQLTPEGYTENVAKKNALAKPINHFSGEAPHDRVQQKHVDDVKRHVDIVVDVRVPAKKLILDEELYGLQWTIPLRLKARVENLRQRVRPLRAPGALEIDIVVQIKAHLRPG